MYYSCNLHLPGSSPLGVNETLPWNSMVPLPINDETLLALTLVVTGARRHHCMLAITHDSIVLVGAAAAGAPVHHQHRAQLPA